MFPRTRISITLQVIQDDGSLLFALINAAMLACLDAALPCVGVVTATTVSVTPAVSYEGDEKNEDNTDEASEMKKKTKTVAKEPSSGLLLDPSTMDEKASPATATFTYTNVGNIVDVGLLKGKTPDEKMNDEAKAEPISKSKQEQELVSCITYGVWSIEDFFNSTNLAKRQCKELYQFIRTKF